MHNEIVTETQIETVLTSETSVLLSLIGPVRERVSEDGFEERRGTTLRSIEEHRGASRELPVSSPGQSQRSTAGQLSQGHDGIPRFQACLPADKYQLGSA